MELKEGRVRKGQIIICPICGKEFVAKYKGTIRCCSKKCTSILKSNKIKIFYKNHPKIKKEKLSYFEKTGYTHPMLNPEHKDLIVNKIKQTKLERYGDANYNNKEQIEQTSFNRYGVNYAGGLKEFVCKAKETKKDRYGDENYNNREKAKQTCLEKYGVESVSKLEETKNKVKDTCIKHYGVDNPAKSEIILKKIKITYEKKTGYKHPSQNPEIKLKKIKTMHTNATFNTSSDEKIIFELLKNKFSIINTQYYNKEKYPFKCDFYIPELDLYIEYQGDWKHSKLNKNKILGPYDANNKIHCEILTKWQNLAKVGKNQYKSAIKTWTISDPLKREVVKKNNLNWIEFFSIDEFKQWLMNI